MLDLRLFRFQFMLLGALILGLLLEISIFPHITKASVADFKKAAQRAKRHARAAEVKRVELEEQARELTVELEKVKKKARSLGTKHSEKRAAYQEALGEITDDTVSTGASSAEESLEAAERSVRVVMPVRKGSGSSGARHRLEPLNGVEVQEMPYPSGGEPLRFVEYKRKFYIVSEGGPPPRRGKRASASKVYTASPDRALESRELVTSLHQVLIPVSAGERKTKSLEIIKSWTEGRTRSASVKPVPPPPLVPAPPAASFPPASSKKHSASTSTSGGNMFVIRPPGHGRGRGRKRVPPKPVTERVKRSAPVTATHGNSTSVMKTPPRRGRGRARQAQTGLEVKVPSSAETASSRTKKTRSRKPVSKPPTAEAVDAGSDSSVVEVMLEELDTLPSTAPPPPAPVPVPSTAPVPAATVHSLLPPPPPVTGPARVRGGGGGGGGGGGKFSAQKRSFYEEGDYSNGAQWSSDGSSEAGGAAVGSRRGATWEEFEAQWGDPLQR